MAAMGARKETATLSFCRYRNPLVEMSGFQEEGKLKGGSSSGPLLSAQSSHEQGVAACHSERRGGGVVLVRSVFRSGMFIAILPLLLIKSIGPAFFAVAPLPTLLAVEANVPPSSSSATSPPRYLSSLRKGRTEPSRTAAPSQQSSSLLSAAATAKAALSSLSGRISSRFLQSNSHGDPSFTPRRSASNTRGGSSQSSSSTSRSRESAGEVQEFLFTPNDVVLSLPEADYRLDVPDSTTASKPLTLTIPMLDGQTRLILRTQRFRSESSPYNPTAASSSSPASSKSPKIYLNSTANQADFIVGNDLQSSTVIMGRLVHRNGTVLIEKNFTVFDDAKTVLDSLMFAPGSWGPWLWADVFPFNGDDFADVHAEANRSLGFRLDSVLHPYTPGSGPRPPSAYTQYQLDSNATFIGLFQSFFGDQFKKKEAGVFGKIETGQTTTAGGSTEDAATSKVVLPLLQLRLPGGTSFAFPPLNFTTLWTEGRVTTMDNSHRQFRKGQPGEIVVDNSNERPFY